MAAASCLPQIARFRINTIQFPAIYNILLGRARTVFITQIIFSGTTIYPDL
jgi:hypothetical protein